MGNNQSQKMPSNPCENKRIGFTSQTSPALTQGMFYPKQLKKSDLYYQEFLKTRERVVYIAQLKKGEVKIYQIHNILTQVHKDILDIILSRVVKQDTMLYIASITKYTLLHSLTRHKHTKNYKWLTEKLEEIAKTFYVAEYKSQNGNNKTEPFTTMSYTYDSVLETFVFKFEPKFIFLFFYLQKYTCQYTALLDKILQIKDETVRAIARFCLTSYNVNMELFELLEKIGYGKINTERTKRYIKKKVKNTANQLQKLGIFYNPTTNIITYNHKNTENLVKIYHRSSCALIGYNIQQTWDFIFS